VDRDKKPQDPTMCRPERDERELFVMCFEIIVKCVLKCRSNPQYILVVYIKALLDWTIDTNDTEKFQGKISNMDERRHHQLTHVTRIINQAYYILCCHNIRGEM